MKGLFGGVGLFFLVLNVTSASTDGLAAISSIGDIPEPKPVVLLACGVGLIGLSIFRRGKRRR